MTNASDKKQKIKYTQDSINANHSIEEKGELKYTKDEIKELALEEMLGKSFHGLPLRTRSKEAKTLVFNSLGYPVPESFKKTQPRLPAQNLDIYVQKSNNLQVWNEDLDPERRYLLIRIDENDIVIGVKVVTGVDLAKLDTTGTLTQKYQARLDLGKEKSELIVETDTQELCKSVNFNSSPDLSGVSPTDEPHLEKIFPISKLYDVLKSLVGHSFSDIGADQERNRGAELHKLICKALGYENYSDDGQFPDIKNQLLEVKLQTSPTIDLGLVCPDSNKELDMNPLGSYSIKHRDVRYALFYAEIDQRVITLTHFYITTGEGFFSRFQQFQGKVLNKKLQIPLPKDFFNEG
jgi:hypothetical protein